jgi:UDP-N-acetylmuramoyl-tripeptide--D-alanyl-D-alanine ligase
MNDSLLWTLETMSAAMGGQPEGSPLPAGIGGISIDTRTIAKGEAFFAIRGENRDGHEFVAAALQGGAGVAVIAANKRAAMPNGAPLVVVPDVLDGLRDLARAARARIDATVIGVTGSVGKTSTKEALKLALSRGASTHASVASYNNHWGVPLSLARCPPTARFAVFEMGMNHAGEIEPLTRLVRPHVAIITEIAPVHLEFFESVEAIADAKAEIFLGLEPGGTAVINRDSRHYAQLRRRATQAGVERIVSFGEHAQSDARLIKLSLHLDCSTVEARIFGTPVTYKLGAPGRHLVLNSLAVLAAATLVGIDLAMAALALA